MTEPCSAIKVTIRPAASADAEKLADLCGQLGYPTTAEDVRRRLEGFSDDRQNVVYVAEADGEAVGWVHAQVRPFLFLDRFVEIGGLVVDEHYRSGGIGQRLMEAAESWARAQACAEVRVRSNVIRVRAHPFYERIGYERTKTQVIFHKTLPAG